MEEAERVEQFLEPVHAEGRVGVFFLECFFWSVFFGVLSGSYGQSGQPTRQSV